MVDPRTRVVTLADSGFSLTQSCGPVAWGKGRWPNTDWRADYFAWVGWEEDSVVHRIVRQQGGQLRIDGDADPAGDEAWLRAVLAVDRTPPELPNDPVVAAIASNLPGLRLTSAGSLFEGLVSSIVGQSITVQAAAVISARLAGLCSPGVELLGRTFWPMPTPERLATLDAAEIRATGVTWRRAEALAAIARAALTGALPSDQAALEDEGAAHDALRALPLVGPWTAASALIWGVGAADAYPVQDVALLRAARAAYGQPEMSHREMNGQAELWRPGRGWAARWLWTQLLGIPT